MAIISNIVIDQGTTFAADIDVTDTNGNALNLTGYTAAGQMRKNYASSTATNFSASVTNNTGGVVRISLTATQTNAIKAGRYLYDVEVSKASTGEVLRIIEGQVEVTPGITRAS